MPDLGALFDPKGIIITGVSNHPGKFGFVTLHNLLASGYEGAVYPVSREPGEVLVSTMVDGNRELIAGLNDDPQFGMTVMVGIGGILAEAIRDVSFRLAPITEVDAAEMLDDLATQRLFGEFRGEPEADRAAIVEALVALARVGVEEPGLRSADLNPLILVDGKPIAVDALLEIEEDGDA